MALIDPFFSIVLPVFNAEATLKKCLDSISGQDFTNYELIVVDGMSSDNTLKLVDEHKGSFLEVKVICGKDDNIYDAMNKGAHVAKGRWLYFIGADDYFHKRNVLSNVYESLKSKTDTELLYGNVKFMDSGKIYNGRYSLARLLITNICHQSCFISNEAFRKYGPFDKRFKVYADWDLNIKVFMQSKKIVYENLVIADYNNASGFSHANIDQEFEEKRLNIKKQYYSNSFRKLQKNIVRLKRFVKKTVFKQGKSGINYKSSRSIYFNENCRFIKPSLTST